MCFSCVWVEFTIRDLDETLGSQFARLEIVPSLVRVRHHESYAIGAENYLSTFSARKTAGKHDCRAEFADPPLEYDSNGPDWDKSYIVFFVNDSYLGCVVVGWCW